MSILFGRHTVEASCVVEIEKTAESFHAYAVPDGVEINPGDVVTVHEAPSDIDYGERLLKECRITVRRAGPLEQVWERFAGLFALTELYEVGFAPPHDAMGEPR